MSTEILVNKDLYRGLCEAKAELSSFHELKCKSNAAYLVVFKLLSPKLHLEIL